jgi:hypothetical protein
MFQIANCGHFPMFSHPEAMVDATRKFLLAPACQFAAACELMHPPPADNCRGRETARQDRRFVSSSSRANA